MKREYMLRATLFGLSERFFVLTVGTLLFSTVDSDLQNTSQSIFMCARNTEKKKNSNGKTCIFEMRSASQAV
jgi:hypothetical protein